MSKACDVHETGAPDRPGRVRRRREKRRTTEEKGGAVEWRNMVTMAVASRIGIVVPTSGITKLEPKATGRKVTIGDEGRDGARRNK